MRLVRICLVACLAVSLIAVPVLASGGAEGQDFASDQILIHFKAGVGGEVKHKIHAKHGGQVVEEIGRINVQVVRVPAGKVLEKIKAYKREGAVDFAEPDYAVEAVSIPNDPYFGQQWGLARISAPQAWDVTSGAAVRIAVLDSGVDLNHEDLTGKVVVSKNFTRSRTFDDLYGHGTHVAGIAAAITDNGRGVAGTAYGSTVMNVKVLGDNGRGYSSWVASGIIWAADTGAKVISMSLGSAAPSSTLENAVNYAWNKGVLLVAAAGNSNGTTPLYPAYYQNCIAVAATDRNDAKAGFSSYGSWVDVAAPGVDIFSTVPNHKNSLKMLNYGSLSGTSMAAPHVAGIAALIYDQVTDADNDGFLNDEVRLRLESTADKTGTIWSDYGIPRVNAYAAVGT